MSTSEISGKVCGGYARVSSPQPKSGRHLVPTRRSRYTPHQENSLPRQRDIITTFHRMLEIQDPLVLFEDDISGANRQREQLRRMIEWIYADRISTVLLENDSRLGRDVLLVEELIQLCYHRRIKIGIWAWKGYVDWENPVHRQSLRLSAVTNQLQRDQMRRMSADGMERALEIGRCGGNHSFGYTVGPDKKLIPEPVEFPLLLRMAKEIRTSGSPSIAKRLEMERRSGAPQGRFQDRPWRPADIQRCLQNPNITGHIVRQWLDDRTGKPAPRESWRIYPAAHEAAVSWGEFDEIQKAIAARRLAPARPAGGGVKRSPYSGLVRCGHHRHRMAAHTRWKMGKKAWSLVCPELNCPNSEVMLADLERLLDENLKPELQRIVSTGEFGETTLALVSDRVKKSRAAIVELLKQIESLDDREASLVGRFAHGGLEGAELEAERAEIKSKRAPLRKDASRLQSDLLVCEKLSEDLAQKRETLTRLAVPLVEMNDDAKRDLVPKVLRCVHLFERERISVEWVHAREATHVA